MRHLLFIIMLCGCACIPVAHAQPGRYSTENKKAIKLYEEGLSCLQMRDIECTQDRLSKAASLDEGFLEPRLLLAELHTQQGNDDQAIAHYEHVLAKAPDFFPNAMYHLGALHFRNGRFDEAQALYDRFLQGREGTASLRRLAQLGQDNCAFAKAAMKAPVPFEPVNLGANVNTEAPEYYPCLSADNSTLLFTRLVKDERSTEGIQEDFYMSRNVGDAWDTSVPLPSIDTHMNEGAGTLSPDGRFIIFTACEIFGEYGADRKGMGSCDLFVSVRAGDRWSPPQNLGPPINTPHWESQPSLSSDGSSLYFIRGINDRDGGRRQDIYVAELQENGTWSQPEMLSERINTPFIEESVQIHPDGRTLYFSSEGHPGMGGLDIFVSRKEMDGSWGKPMNLGYPINTSGDENSLVISADGRMAFFASDRPGGMGDLDLYGFELYEAARPVAVSYIKGKVIDKFSFKPLEAQLELIDLVTGDVATSTISDARTGEFLLCLPAGRDYALNAAAPDHLFYSANYNFKDVRSIDEPYELIAELSPLRRGEVITLKNIFFETASAELLPRSTAELDRLVTLLERHPELRVELGGHTDAVGADADNQQLSERRASAVRDYVIHAGVMADRLTAKGYGETMPVASNDTEEGRALNRRTEVKVL